MNPTDRNNNSHNNLKVCFAFNLSWVISLSHCVISGRIILLPPDGVIKIHSRLIEFTVSQYRKETLKDSLWMVKLIDTHQIQCDYQL